jgi:hypothetical protein
LFIQRVRLNAASLFLPRRRQNPAIFLPIFKVSKPDATCKRRDRRVVSQIESSGLRWFAVHSFAWRKRSALVITETELKLMAAPAMIGL